MNDQYEMNSQDKFHLITYDGSTKFTKERLKIKQI